MGSKKKLRLLSLFSGCGGMDLGFDGEFPVLYKSINPNSKWKTKKIDSNWVLLPKTRFEIVFANDIRKDANLTWINYFNKKKIASNIYHLESIVDIVKSGKKEIFPDNISIVTGGFPCQDFSVAGKREGFNSSMGHDGKKIDAGTPSVESRGQLYMWMREVISIVKPKIFVAENVKGLASLQDIQRIIESDFSSINKDGYLVVPAKILRAADFGVPQSRERIIFIGFKKSALKKEALVNLQKDDIPQKYDPYPKKTHINSPDDKESKLLKYVTCRDAFVDLKEPEFSDDLSQIKYSKAKYLPKMQGNSEIKLDMIGPTIRSEHHGNIEFRRLSTEHGGKNLEELTKGLNERRLTVRECARLQTFPDDYEFVIDNKKKSVSASSAYKLIGNAVPPLLAYHIAKRIEENWDLYFKEK